MPQSVLQQCVPNRAAPKEYGGAGEPDLETRDVESVDGELEPEQNVVEDTDGDRGRDTVCRNRAELARCRVDLNARTI